MPVGMAADQYAVGRRIGTERGRHRKAHDLGEPGHPGQLAHDPRQRHVPAPRLHQPSKEGSDAHDGEQASEGFHLGEDFFRRGERRVPLHAGGRGIHLCRPGGSHGVFAHIRVHRLTDGSGPVHPACGGACAVLFRLRAHHVGFRHVQRKPAGSDDSQNEPQDAARAPPRRRKRAASAFHCFLTMMSDRYSSGRSATASRSVRRVCPSIARCSPYRISTFSSRLRRSTSALRLR